MWWYTLGVLVLWIINPELRRLYDWGFGYSTVELLSILPLLSVIPHLWALTLGGGWRRLPRPLAIAGWLWLSAFAYALVIGLANGNGVPGTYTFVTYVFPVAIGLWVAAQEVPLFTAYTRLARVLFAVTTFVSIYAIVQYVFAPAWDLAWLRHVIADGTGVSFGQPAAFRIRVFSTLNSPGVFAVYMAMVLLFALPQLSLRRPALLVQMPLWLIAFGLSLVRAGWLMFAVGAVAYLILTPRRRTLLTTCGVAAALFTALAVLLPSAIGNDQLLTSLSSRFATFSDLDNDVSARARQEVYARAGDLISVAPFGQGLGVTGTSTKLSDAQTSTVLDSGLLARIIEMGLPGFALYVAALLVLAGTSLREWNEQRRVQNRPMQSLAAMSIGTAMSFGASQLFGDGTSLQFLLLWLVLCVTVPRQASVCEARASGHTAPALTFA